MRVSITKDNRVQHPVTISYMPLSFIFIFIFQLHSSRRMLVPVARVENQNVYGLLDLGPDLQSTLSHLHRCSFLALGAGISEAVAEGWMGRKEWGRTSWMGVMSRRKFTKNRRRKSVSVRLVYLSMGAGGGVAILSPMSLSLVPENNKMSPF